MTSNTDIELRIAHCVTEHLRRLEVLPEGYQCDVHLHRGNRKKRRDAEFEPNWDPDADSIRISFSPTEEEVSAVSARVADADRAEARLSDLLRALDRAENRPGYEFISLKWFRDSALPREDMSWTSDEAARHDLLREAIDRGWILTRKVANPRPPNFPVTAIRLNRSMREVASALGLQNSDTPAFSPINIRGESLSSTVLRDRR